MRIAMVAGEVSGDFLAAGLIRSLKDHASEIQTYGIAGPQMIAEGCKPSFDMEKLSVMGFAEVLTRLPGIFSIRRKLINQLLMDPPDLFIGVDAPDFNLKLEEKLKSHGILTIHYVSPSVWAWRAARVNQIRRAVDLMLTLFPFEEQFYKEHGINARYVGHPLADLIPIESKRTELRTTLGLTVDDCVVAVLPGSRIGEVKRMGPVFCKAMRQLSKNVPKIKFISPMATDTVYKLFKSMVDNYAADISIRLLTKQSQVAMTASDAVMVVSGTAALEAMLCKRPMVIGYKMSPLTYRYMKKLMTVNQYSLPNNLAGHEVAKEYIQEQAVPENFANEIKRILSDTEGTRKLEQEFTGIHLKLRTNANQKAASAIMEFMTP
ncbi:MAG: lipid-A-disaccharide synthase [Gammaproteobacteria bacterium]|nr:MAG: lipid-A-disaccharide synthase [Gammaproteobacteria bacterium]